MTKKVEYSSLTFGQIVRLAREEASLSHHNLAAILQLAETDIGRIEHDHFLSTETVDKVVKYFQLDKLVMARLNLYNSTPWKDYYTYTHSDSGELQ
jgi:ribosome-binding protein aMBF1 (putative translation factor)